MFGFYLYFQLNSKDDGKGSAESFFHNIDDGTEWFAPTKNI